MAIDSIPQVIQSAFVHRLPSKIDYGIAFIGGGCGNCAQHSQSFESWLAQVPGLIIVAPSTPADAKGLLKSSIRADNPVVFIEHKLLYNTKGDVKKPCS